MQLKAFCKSQNNPPTIILLLRDDNILLINVYIAISVELVHLKAVFPNLFDVAVTLTSLFISHGTP